MSEDNHFKMLNTVAAFTQLLTFFSKHLLQCKKLFKATAQKWIAHKGDRGYSPPPTYFVIVQSLIDLIKHRISQI